MSREVNPELANYMTAVNAMLEAHAGVSYSEIYQDIHGDLSAMRIAYESGVPAGSFASRVIQEQNLCPISEEGAGEINRRRAALVAFSREAMGWYPTVDGGLVTSPDVAGEAYVLKVTQNDKGKFGFVAEHVNPVNVHLDPNMRVSFEAVGPAEVLGGGADIGDAVRAYEMHRDLASHSRPTL